jgi:hypothetical protein
VQGAGARHRARGRPLAEITEQYLSFARFPKPVLAPEDPNALLGSLLDFLEEEHHRAG